MNILFKKVKAFLSGLFTRTKKVVKFPQEEEHDLFIGVWKKINSQLYKYPHLCNWLLFIKFNFIISV